jgi:uncharacterized protein (DUF433 family)
MNNNGILDRIFLDPKILAGKPVIRGTRLSVQFILGMLGSGATAADIIAEYPGLTAEDVQACLMFAQKSLEDITFVPLVKEAV